MMKAHYTVCLVFHRAIGLELLRLVRAFYCWVIESAENLELIDSIGERLPSGGDPLENGITIFQFDGTTEDFAEIIQGVMDHHNEHQHDPGVSELRVYGLSLEDGFRDELESWGFDHFQYEEGGFSASIGQ